MFAKAIKQYIVLDLRQLVVNHIIMHDEDNDFRHTTNIPRALTLSLHLYDGDNTEFPKKMTLRWSAHRSPQCKQIGKSQVDYVLGRLISYRSHFTGRSLRDPSIP